jgi:hypothetical protein
MISEEMRLMLWQYELALRAIETNAGFSVVHPDTWVIMRPQLEAQGVKIYEADRPDMFYLDGERIEHRWVEPNGTEHHSIHFTGIKLFLSPEVSTDKALLYSPKAGKS